jgi:hypothetical protein
VLDGVRHAGRPSRARRPASRRLSGAQRRDYQGFLDMHGRLRAAATRSRPQRSHACGQATRVSAGVVWRRGWTSCWAPGALRACSDTGSGACPCLRAAQEAVLSRAQPASRPTHSPQPFDAARRVFARPAARRRFPEIWITSYVEEATALLSPLRRTAGFGGGCLHVGGRRPAAFLSVCSPAASRSLP